MFPKRSRGCCALDFVAKLLEIRHGKMGKQWRGAVD